MSVLARRSGVPASTIKYYLKEGLIPPPAKSGRNMALYDVATIPRIQAIKELQKKHYLPLAVIKEMLEEAGDATHDLTTAEAIARVLSGAETEDGRTRTQLLAAGMPAGQLDWLRDADLITPEVTDDGEEVYRGDDLELLKTLGEARRRGIGPEMLPFEILQTYLGAIRTLVRAELQMYRQGVQPLAGEELSDLAESATRLSERLVVLIRRKMLLPTLRDIVGEAGTEESES